MPARPALIALLGLVLTGTLFATGCDDEDGTGVILPAIEFRTTTPRDAVRINTAGSDTVVLDLSVTFTRAAKPDEIFFEMFPPLPRSGPVVRSVTGRNWSWRDVAMAEADSAYFWLVDGLEVLQPKVIRLVVSDIVSASGFAGTIRSSVPSQVSVQGTVIFALPAESEFNPLDPITFLNVDPLAAATTDSLGSPSERNYLFTHLRTDETYVVVAIVDTSGDARYDPTADWWGYRVDPGGGPQVIRAAIPLLGPYRSDVDIVVRQPATPEVEP